MDYRHIDKSTTKCSQLQLRRRGVTHCQSGFPILSDQQELPPRKFTQMSLERRSTTSPFVTPYQQFGDENQTPLPLQINLVGKLHRENTTFLRFWISVPTAARSITARSKGSAFTGSNSWNRQLYCSYTISAITVPTNVR